MAKRRKAELTDLSSIIGGMRFPASVRDHVKNHQIWSKWSEIVGPELSKVTLPLEIRSRSLLVQVAHQAWAQQLHFLKPSILGKIRAHCPNAKLKDLQFRVGKVDRPIPKSELSSPLPPTRTIQLSERQEMTLRAVEDPSLRDSIRKAMEAEATRLSTN